MAFFLSSSKIKPIFTGRVTFFLEFFDNTNVLM